jgi:microcystin-dependent protein
MTYQVNYSDSANKTPITVYDNTTNTDTSLSFPGRNVTGYGQTIAEDLLHLLENFSSANAPVAPIQGQLWYDSLNGYLKLWDGTTWQAASNIQRGLTEPNVVSSKVGELWVDTTNQQLRIFTGTRWILVGPTQSSKDGLRYGPEVDTVADTDNITRNILTFYIADIPVVIFSKDSFTPKTVIPGFTSIKSGVNITVPTTAQTSANTFIGGLLPKLYGSATAADALNVSSSSGTSIVSAAKFLQTDQINTVTQQFNVRNSSGITLGVDSTFRISNSSTSATIYNSQSGSSIDLQTVKNGVPNTVLRILGTNVGVNNPIPAQPLDVVGNIATSGSLLVTSTTDATNLNTGSIITSGGVAVTRSVLVGGNVNIQGTTVTTTVQPSVTDAYDSGTSTLRWNNVRAKNVIADSVQVQSISGNVFGNAQTATALQYPTTFSITGDVQSTSNITFDGSVGGYTKTFNTSFTASIISAKDEVSSSLHNDYVLVYRSALSQAGQAQSGLIKQQRDVFIGDLGVPIGAILPYAGGGAETIPTGYLLCDGSEVETVKYPDLYNIIGSTYNGSAALNGVGTFRLPDLRGRFPLGRDNMTNGLTVPNALGGYVSAGGGTVGRVPDTNAQSIGSSAGQSATTLTLANLPDHEHTLSKNGIQYAAVTVDTAINPPAVPGLGPTNPGQMQYLQESGSVKVPDPTVQLGQQIGIMNPYLTINYIIRSGPPAFTTSA